MIECNGVKMCTIFDTGAQVSLITKDIWERINSGNEVMFKENSIKLSSGIIDRAERCIGRVMPKTKSEWYRDARRISICCC